jgi:glyoxylase-like metal-dependent hydrolase (beta-lactamase superfamily II)
MSEELTSVRWIHGSPQAGATDPPIQVHEVDPDTFILRQSKDVTYEAPFLYLFCGDQRALLLDSGDVADAAKCPVRATVDQLLASRDPSYELVVAHTHGHGDHIAGDGQFTGRPVTTVVAREADAVRSFFGFTDWPAQVVRFDLGGRELEVTGSPGHHDAAVTIFDPRTGWLMTGDTVYPGRLYVPDMAAFTASLDRMADFCASRPVSAVLGCHIEMTRSAGRDYPIGWLYQPDEPPLPMTVAALTAVRDAAAAVAARPGAHVFDDFIIYNGPCRVAKIRLMLRGWWWRLRDRTRTPR